MRSGVSRHTATSATSAATTSAQPASDRRTGGRSACGDSVASSWSGAGLFGIAGQAVEEREPDGRSPARRRCPRRSGLRRRLGQRGERPGAAAERVHRGDQRAARRERVRDRCGSQPSAPRAAGCAATRSRRPSAGRDLGVEDQVALGVESHRSVAEVRRADARDAVVDDHHLGVDVHARRRRARAPSGTAGAAGRGDPWRAARRSSARAQTPIELCSSQPCSSRGSTTTISGPSGSRQAARERVRRPRPRSGTGSRYR